MNATTPASAPSDAVRPALQLVEDEQRIEIALQLQAQASAQMVEIKRDEMSWLKIFLLFYAAMIGWMVSRWSSASATSVSFNSPILTVSIPVPASVQYSTSEAVLLWASVGFSFFATIMFSLLFSHTRRSYYGVVHRLHQFQRFLRLYDKKYWGNIKFFPLEHTPGEVLSKEDWRRQTKPWSSFLTRMGYIVAGNLCVDFLAFLSFGRLGLGYNSLFLPLWLLLSIVLVWMIYSSDYHHSKDEWQRWRKHEEAE